MFAAICFIILLLYLLMDWENCSEIVIPILVIIVCVGLPLFVWKINVGVKEQNERDKDKIKQLTKEKERLDMILESLSALKKKYGKPDKFIPSTCIEPRFLAIYSKHKILVINNIEIPFSDVLSCKLVEESMEDEYDDIEEVDDFADEGWEEIDYDIDYCDDTRGLLPWETDKKKTKKRRIVRRGISYSNIELHITFSLPDNPTMKIIVGDNLLMARELEGVFKTIIKKNSLEKRAEILEESN